MSTIPPMGPEGEEMYGWATDLFPIARSLTGPGVRQTLAYLQDLIPGLEIHSVPSGTQVFDWTVPNEWTIRDAYVADEQGNRVIDFRRNNLHLVGYSIPVDTWLTLDELQPHLYSIPSQPDAIPYVTAYYAPRWGFCLSHRQREALKLGRYHVVVDSTLAPGVLNYAELLLPGREDREILLSTYVCHPSMANNELSGPVVAAALARWLAGRDDRRYGYRIVFVPETIGSIAYLSRNLPRMKPATVAGFVLSCLGDDRTYSLVGSRLGDTLADRAAQHVLKSLDVDFKLHTFRDRGSDERQYCSPGVDLPVCGLCRTKYGCYPEYHTSLDDLSVISPQGLWGGFIYAKRCCEVVEANRTYRAVMPCEPQLGKRGLYPTVSQRENGRPARALMDVLAYSDGNHDMLALAERIGFDALYCAELSEMLVENGLLERVDPC